MIYNLRLYWNNHNSLKGQKERSMNTFRNTKSFFIALFAIALFAAPASALTLKGSTEPLTPEETEAVLPFYEVSYKWHKKDNSNVAIITASNGNNLPEDDTLFKNISSLRNFIVIRIDGENVFLIIEKDNNASWLEIQPMIESSLDKYNGKAKVEK